MVKTSMGRWLFAYLTASCAWAAAAQAGPFNFGVIAPPAMANESDLRANLLATDNDDLAFVVVHGVKSTTEPCTDALYERRKNILGHAKHGLIVSPTGSDWSTCKNAQGKSIALDRLNHLRDLFYGDEFSDGANKIPLARQSTMRKFHSYAENARWEFGNIMFTTINLPANNNHYRPEAGRNSEFEDRLVANRDWLRRIFTLAIRQKRDGIVLFCDGNPWTKPDEAQLSEWGIKRDGFAETRQHLKTLAAKFPGKILIVHGQTPKPPTATGTIQWDGNVGVASIGSGWVKINVRFNPMRFNLATESLETAGAP